MSLPPRSKNTPGAGGQAKTERSARSRDVFTRAYEVSVYVVRAFVRLRELAATHGDLATRLDELEQKTEGLALSHDTFSRNTRQQLKRVFDALRELMTPPDPPKRPIGFVTPDEKTGKS